MSNSQAESKKTEQKQREELLARVASSGDPTKVKVLHDPDGEPYAIDEGANDVKVQKQEENDANVRATREDVKRQLNLK